MTKDQYREMVNDFSKFAGMDIPYKSFNVHYEKGSKVDYKRYKYHYKHGILRGVGIEGNAWHLIIQELPYAGRLSAIHYQNVIWPL